VEHYEFSVWDANEAIAAMRSAALADLRAAWEVVVELAQSVETVGGRIRVTNQAGDLLILVGVETARSFAKPRKEVRH
jgi:hypothetical protein